MCGWSNYYNYNHRNCLLCQVMSSQVKRIAQFLPPALAEEVIFSVASVCVSVCALQAESLEIRT